MGRVFVGHDWAEDHHDEFIEDDSGRRLAGGRLTEGIEGIARFHELLVSPRCTSGGHESSWRSMPS